MPGWPFSASRANKDADLLLAQVAKASRNPAFFGEGRASDTLQGRFEMMAAHATLALLRLRQAPEAEPLAQAFVDALFRHLDHGLREHGIGDLAVPKRMHKLAGAFYGRANAYAAALAGPDPAELAAALQRDVAGTSGAFAAALARHMCDLATAQAAAPWERLLTSDGWAPFAG
ncbi:MAG: ubiquinol-cytochrome C chaperone [Proteobacteria bacterium]|nr:ubiquinol-cytochrome C chaperone [Pseudomonadota bacterium]